MRGLKPITKIRFFMSVRTPVLQMSLLGGVRGYLIFKVKIYCLFGEKRKTNYALYEELRKVKANSIDNFVTEIASVLRKVRVEVEKPVYHQTC